MLYQTKFYLFVLLLMLKSAYGLPSSKGLYSGHHPIVSYHYKTIKEDFFIFDPEVTLNVLLIREEGNMTSIVLKKKETQNEVCFQYQVCVSDKFWINLDRNSNQLRRSKWIPLDASKGEGIEEAVMRALCDAKINDHEDGLIGDLTIVFFSNGVLNGHVYFEELCGGTDLEEVSKFFMNIAEEASNL